MIRVWTNENCVQCDRTKKFLDDNNIEYLTLSLKDNPDDLIKFIDMGFKSAPIVETENDIWSGFKFDKLQSLLDGDI